jgi:hypothetical protein
MNQPIIEQIRGSLPEAKAVGESVQNVTGNIVNSVSSATESVKSSLGDFSKKGIMDASSEFLSSNGLLAKFAFIFLILLVFMFLFKLGVLLIGYFTLPPNDPYLIKGMIGSNQSVSISQDPSDKNAVIVNRSNNQTTGAEFTYSFWLYINPYKTPSGVNIDPASTAALNSSQKYDTVFVKGDVRSGSQTTDGINLSNGPGVYTQALQNGTVNLYVIMDLVNNTTTKSPNSVTVNNLPIQKWFHVAVRAQNTLLDVYINGVIAGRQALTNYPQQNYYNVNVFPGGIPSNFNGQLSNLRYYSRALNVFEINNVVMFGPNTTPSSSFPNPNLATGNYTYLSSGWYMPSK